MNCVSQRTLFRFAQKQVDVFRHNNEAVHEHLEMLPHSFETDRKEVVGSGVEEERLPPVTTECDEVGLSGIVDAV